MNRICAPEVAASAAAAVVVIARLAFETPACVAAMRFNSFSGELAS